jgi:hypothetical protein
VLILAAVAWFKRKSFRKYLQGHSIIVRSGYYRASTSGSPRVTDDVETYARFQPSWETQQLSGIPISSPADAPGQEVQTKQAKALPPVPNECSLAPIELPGTPVTLSTVEDYYRSTSQHLSRPPSSLVPSSRPSPSINELTSNPRDELFLS